MEQNMKHIKTLNFNEHTSKVTLKHDLAQKANLVFVQIKLE